MTIHYHIKRHMAVLAATGTAPGMPSMDTGVFSVKKRSNPVDFSAADGNTTYPNDVIMDGVHPVLPFIIISPLDTGFSLHCLDVTPFVFSDDVVLVECAAL